MFGGGAGLANAQSGGDSLADLLANHGELASTLTALEAIGLGDRLGDCAAEPLTVLAPIDTAFISIAGELGATPEELLADVASLEQILPHHLVEGANDIETLLATGLNPTLHGDDLDAFAEEGLILLDGYASVLEPDLVACNGVLHTIDSVLVPLDFAISEAPEVEGAVGEIDGEGEFVEATADDGQRGLFLALSILTLGAGIGMVTVANRRRPS